MLAERGRSPPPPLRPEVEDVRDGSSVTFRLAGSGREAFSAWSSSASRVDGMPCVRSGRGLCGSCCWAWAWASAGSMADGEVDCGAVF